MIKKITVAFALIVAFSGSAFASTGFDGSNNVVARASLDGSNDLIEAFGGTRNGGDC